MHAMIILRVFHQSALTQRKALVSLACTDQVGSLWLVHLALEAAACAAVCGRMGRGMVCVRR